jgi:signal transduction histidine kinase
MTEHHSSDDRITSMLRFGLSRTIQLHTERFRAGSPALKVDLDLVDDENLLPEAACHMLFKVYSEAMRNIEHHAEAGLVSVRYFIERNHVVLEIHDDGHGFNIPSDWAKFTATGSGVMGAKARLEAFGGKLHIDSTPGQSTTIRASLPISESHAE